MQIGSNHPRQKGSDPNRSLVDIYERLFSIFHKETNKALTQLKGGVE